MKRLSSLALLAFASCGHFLPVDGAEPIKTTNQQIAELKAELAAVKADQAALKARADHAEAFAVRVAGYRPLAVVGTAPASPAAVPATVPRPAAPAYRTGPLGLIRWRVKSGECPNGNCPAK